MSAREAEDERHDKAKALVMELLDKQDACASVQVLKEFHAVATKKVARPLSSREAANIIRDLCVSCRITDETVPQLQRALDLVAKHRLSIWDALIVAAAEAAGCARLYTENLTDGAAIGAVRIINPVAPAAAL